MPETFEQERESPQYSYREGEEDGGISIDFGRILGALRKYFWVVLLFLVAGAIAAVTYLNVATPIYQSATVVKIEQRVMDASPLSGATTSAFEDLRALEMLGTIQRGFLSRTLMERVTEKLKLVDRPEFLGPDVPVEDRTEAECVEMLLKNTNADVVRGTRLIQITFDHPDENLATEVTAALVREYVALDGEQRLRSAGSNISYLINEKDALERKLRESEQELAQYSQSLNSVSVDSELNIIAEQLRELNSRLTLAKADRLKLESDFDQVQSVRDDPSALLQISSVAQLPEIQALRAQLNELNALISAQKNRYGLRNPAIIELESQRDSLRETLQAEALRAPRTLEISLRAARQNEASFERETKAQEKKTLNVKKLAIQSSVLERKIEADKLAFQAVLERLSAESSQARSPTVFVQTVDAASPAYQVKPKPLIVIALAVVASMALAGATIFLLAILDTSIKSVDEAESALGLPVMAAIPEMSAFQAGKKNRAATKNGADGGFRLPLLEDTHSTVSEAFRTLRASLLMADTETKRFLVTSAVPGEGKSFCAINAAVALAQQDADVLLIDSDLRKPTVEARLFDAESSAPGLADFLTGRADFAEIVRQSEVPGLFVITAGRKYSNPSELLSRKERLEDLLRLAEEKFSRIVVDSAPVLAVSDTLSLAPHFSVISLVIRSHKTGRKFVRRATDLLARTGHPARGLALNMVPTKGAAYNYYYTHAAGGKSYGDHTSPAVDTLAKTS